MCLFTSVILRVMFYENCWLGLPQDKYQLRLKVLEESLRTSSSGGGRLPVEGRSIGNGPLRRQSLGGAENAAKASPNGFLTKRTPSQPRSSLSFGASTVLKHAKGTSKSFDGGSRSLERSKSLVNGSGVSFPLNKSSDPAGGPEPPSSWKESSQEKPADFSPPESEDMVSGLLYDMLQKEVVNLRKAIHEKDQSLKDKDDAIEVGAPIYLFARFRI